MGKLKNILFMDVDNPNEKQMVPLLCASAPLL